MKEILKIHFTLYSEDCEIREEELDTDRIVLLSNPKKMVIRRKF